MNKSALRCLLSFCLLLTPFVSAQAAKTFNPDAAAALVKIEGETVWEQAADERLPQASITKVMTAVMILEKYQPDTIVKITAKSAAARPTKIGLRAGDRVRLSDLLAAALVHSANDACHALAVWHSGSEEKFAERMNARAEKMGLRDTHFVNACGFDAEGHYSTARDVAVLAEIAMQNRTFRRLVNKQQMVIRTVDGKRKFAFRSTNALIGKYEGARGVNTVFTFKAGPCLVAVSERGDTRVMIVLLNARNRWPNARQMFDLAFEQSARQRQERVASHHVAPETSPL